MAQSPCQTNPLEEGFSQNRVRSNGGVPLAIPSLVNRHAGRARAEGRRGDHRPEGVPASVLTTAFHSRFASFGFDDFTDKVLSAMRKGSGGHREKKS